MTISPTSFYPQEIGRNIDEILRALTALQLSDKEGVATPANWPNNRALGDAVIIPPATSIEEAEARKRRDDIECFDWWFCYKK